MQGDVNDSDGVRGSSTTGGYTPMDDQEPSTSRGTSSFLGKIPTRNVGRTSLKRSAGTSDDDPNTPIKKSRSTYSTGGLTRNFHGVVYQLKHLGFTLCRAMELNEELPFYLSSERMDVGQFDDLVLEYSIDGGRKAAIFLQLKHSRDETKKVKAGDLLEVGKNENFCMQKYFNSWREINKSKQFNVPKKLILGTNIGLDSEDLRKAEISYEPIDMSDKGFDMIATKDETECCKFIPDRGRNRKLYDKLKQMSDVHLLARKLAEHIHGRKKLELRGDIFKRYHVALGKQVIDIEDNNINPRVKKPEISPNKQKHDIKVHKFRSEFIKGPKKPPEVSNFYRIFCAEFSKLKPSKTLELERIRIEVSDKFGKSFVPSANPNLRDIDKFTGEFVKLLKTATNDGLVLIPRNIYTKKVKKGSVKKIVADNIDELAGHVLITEDGKIKFSTRFIDDKIKSPGNIEEFKEQLKFLLGTLEKLRQYQFEINNFNTCEEAHVNKNVKLPDDEISDDEVKDFLGIFYLVVNLPNEVELGDMIKDEVSDKFSLLNADLIGKTFLMKMIEWFKGNVERVGEGSHRY